MTHDEIEWTPEEREALDALSREEDPGRLLEEKTVAALKARGLLGDNARTDSLPGSRRRGGPGMGPGAAGRFHPAWWAAGIAAALAIFFGGLAVGQARAGISSQDLVTALRSAEAAERPSLVQQTGSLYVDALAGLALVADEDAVGTGVEVGLAALYAAAYELARLHPEDARLREVLRALETPADDNAETDVHWF